jgi:hypothetical protein
MAPNPNTQKIWWELNRNEIAIQTDSIRLSAQLLNSGQNNLTCFILDTTSYIRKSTHPTVHLNKVIWTINYQPNRIDYEVVSGKTIFSIYPNPVSETINLSYKTDLPSNAELLVRLIDSSGKPVTRSYSFRLTGADAEYQIQLPRRQLSAGIYYLIAETAGHAFRLPVVIR